MVSINSRTLFCISIVLFSSTFLTSVYTLSVYKGPKGSKSIFRVQVFDDNDNTLNSNFDPDPAESPLFYGWFIDDEASSSLDKISQSYFFSLLNQVPEFGDFINYHMKEYNITNPFEYFKKPLDPDTNLPVISYHVTAKYCGRQDCSNYAKIAAPYIGNKFQIHIIGLFITPRTFGFRIRLTAEEEDLFEEKLIKKYNESPKIFTRKNKSTPKATDFPGIHFYPQGRNFHPSNSKAHSTSGCAPNISAVQTGLDLREIDNFELQQNISYKYYSIRSPVAGTVRRFGEITKQLAFVVYPSLEMIVNGTFKFYI